VPAPRWDEFRAYFNGKRVVQFTATPFRRDSKRIDGTIVFNYPMRLAQAEGYFKPITLVPVRAYDRALHHERIAEAAIKQLKDDTRSGYRHLVMARTETIERATEVHSVYSRLAPELRPVLVHSRKGQKATRDALAALRAGTSSVVVCVDMLGEGFDLPQLKIAALHDVHKSLAITLQFTGRFTRATPKVGNASVIANVADAEVEDTLEALYAEDADWNLILRRLSEGATGRELRRSELLQGFADPPAQIRLENLLPKMTTLVYRTKAKQWHPKAISTVVPADVLFAGPTINHKARLAMFVTKSASPVPWGRYKHLLDTIYDLHLVHWSESRGLFFVNSTDKDSSFDALTKAVMGDGASPDQR
jgi:hypothetical protein